MTLGAVLLSLTSLSSFASNSVDINKLLKTDQPQTNTAVISFLDKSDNEEKLQFFREAFEKQKLHLFENPDQYFDESYPLKEYVKAWSLTAQLKKDPENTTLQKDIQAFIT